MLDAVLPYLHCPVCQGELARTGSNGPVRCERGHSFDVARQGYLNLLRGHTPPGSADTAAMVEARARFLESGAFGPLEYHLATELAARTAGLPEPRLVVDAGGGPGYYLARALDELPGAGGLAIDVSKHAARRAARAHRRIGAVCADVWTGLPVRSGTASAVLNVFAPRNGAEFARVLRPGGVLFVVTPTADHLADLVAAGLLLTVDDRKDERVRAALGDQFELAAVAGEMWDLDLRPDDVVTLAGMGPVARHRPEAELRARAAALPDPVTVQLSVEVSVYQPRVATLEGLVR